MAKKQQLRNSRKWGIAVLIIGAFLVPIGSAIFVEGWDLRQRAIMTLNGELNPFPIDLTKPFVVAISKISGNLTDKTFSIADLAKGIDLRQIFPANFTSNQFKIDFIDNRLSISADIRNSDGTRIAQIINNEWKTVDPSTLLFWDRNHNAYAFEIIGSDGIPTLQVMIVGPNRIQIGGLFYTETGSLYFEPVPDGAVIYVNAGNEHRERNAIVPIPKVFKYPALTNSDNLGKMTDSYYPSSNPLAESTWIMVASIILAALGAIVFSFGFEKCKSANEQLNRINAQIQAKKNKKHAAKRQSKRQ